MKEKKRCDWCLKDDLYKNYHDTEWGDPVYDDQKLFEYLNLEGAQAGLSWYTVLTKKENYRKAFSNWDAKKIVKYDQKKIDNLLQNPGIIRNKLKVNGVITNARIYLEIQKEYGSFSDYIWQFVDGKPIINKWKKMTDIPATTTESDEMSKVLKKRGFKFVGSTICYAYMQAVGMVDDHLAYCWKR
ncbi:MAG: DNA-3-methyladenine glycosylase I [Bacteroidia bacterium]|nr:DNA-3-methyladenine glycosylase I [Bacteroidia bacterium]